MTSFPRSGNTAIRLLFPIPYSRPGGVERVVLSLLKALSQSCECIVIVVSNRDRQHYEQILPPSTIIQYQSEAWPQNSSGQKILNRLYQLRSLLEKLRLKPLTTWINRWINRHRSQVRLQALIDQHQLTHCLYCLINRVDPPHLSIPVTGILYDLFWHFAPLTYDADYIRRYDQGLLKWLQSADRLFSISEKTRQDLLTIFPEFEHRVETIPISGFPDNDNLTPTGNQVISPVVEFYYPSSFGIYKDQLTFLKAGVKLVQSGFDLKLTLTGKETDGLVSGQPVLSQQSTTQEFQVYLQGCQRLYQQHQDIFETHFSGLGYCSLAEVEACFQRCSCIVMTSCYEGFGLAVSEAIVRGIPVICSDLPVFREQITLYNCEDRVRFFPVGNAEALAGCMADFIQNPIARLPPEEAMHRFGHWRWRDVAKSYTAYLTAL
jgi:glycosyltransferase involved in cell wall biosynthesis